MTAHLVKFSSDQLPVPDGMTLPSVEEHKYSLVDDDAKVCRIIGEDEFNASYVDYNIQTFQLDGVDWLTLDVDNHFVLLTYASGTQTSLLLGSIDFNAGVMAEQYGKTNGVIYPIDAGGTLLFNQTNTPNLAAIRTWYFNEAKRLNDDRVKIANIVYSFAKDIGGGANFDMSKLDLGKAAGQP
jgi:hypothetical protein